MADPNPVVELQCSRAVVAAGSVPTTWMRGSEMAKGTCSIDGCQIEASIRGWCERHYMAQYRATHKMELRASKAVQYRVSVGKDPPGLIDQPIATQDLGERLLRRIRIAPNSCWIWQGARGSEGYGRIGWHSKVIVTHRASYEAFVGPVPPGLDIDHLCHNADAECPGGFACIHRCCVNPEHLQAATRSENLRRSGRMSRKGFAAWDNWSKSRR